MLQNFVCSHPDLVLEGKVSPRRNKYVHQLDPHLVPAEVLLPALDLCPKQLLVLVWDLVHHVAHLLAEVQHRLPEKNTHALGRKVSFLSVFGWVFTFSALQGPGGNGDLGVINCATLKGTRNMFLGHSLHTESGSVMQCKRTLWKHLQLKATIWWASERKQQQQIGRDSEHCLLPPGQLLRSSFGDKRFEQSNLNDDVSSGLQIRLQS